jgi:hypothetical protein
VTGPGTAPGGGARPLRIDTRRPSEPSAPVGAVLGRPPTTGHDLPAALDDAPDRAVATDGTGDGECDARSAPGGGR